MPGFDHARHPVSVLGSDLSPHRVVFRIAGAILPGIAVAVVALALEWRLGGAALGRAGRIGASLLLIAGGAFALQGVFPLDPDALDGVASQRHAATRGAALLAFLAAVAALAWPLWKRLQWRVPVLLGLAAATVIGADLIWSLGAILPGWRTTPGLSERLILGAWLTWPAVLGLRAIR